MTSSSVLVRPKAPEQSALRKGPAPPASSEQHHDHPRYRKPGDVGARARVGEARAGTRAGVHIPGRR
jgi:hypothetical protein